MFHYSAYGYILHSEIELPGYIESQERRATDITIVCRDLPAQHVLTEARKKKVISLSTVPDGLNINWPGVAAYNIQKEGRISFSPTLPTEQGTLAFQPFYGIVLAGMLHLKNHFVLHGSTVESNGTALAIVGRKGSGKSSLAASLVAHGCNLLADDVTAVTVDGFSTVQALSGVPRLKLWPDVVRFLGRKPEMLPLVAPTIPKHVLIVPKNQFCQRQIPLKKIIMLEYGDEVELKEMRPAENMTWLIGGNYFTRFQQMFSADVHKRWFHTCALLAKNISIIKARWPRGLGNLPELVRQCIRLTES